MKTQSEMKEKQKSKAQILEQPLQHPSIQCRKKQS